jgi:quercetin dioxygenase-like cupin family protein
VVLTGEIVLRLDSGDEKTVHAGEYIIQGGANHQWINRTNDTCRTMFVTVSAEKIKLACGMELEETVLKN